MTVNEVPYSTRSGDSHHHPKSWLSRLPFLSIYSHNANRNIAGSASIKVEVRGTSLLALTT